MIEDKNKRITSIIPLRGVYEQINKSFLREKLRDEKIEIYNSQFILNEKNELVIENKKDLEIAKILAYYRYCLEHSYLSDIATGIYNMILNKNEHHKFIKLEEMLTKSYRTNQIERRGIMATMTKEVFYQAMFGVLLDDKGQAIDGVANDIIKIGKETIEPIIKGIEPTPQATVFVVKNKKDNKEQYIITGEPLHIYQKIKSDNKEVITVYLNYLFYPLINFKEPLPIGLYIHQVNGLTSFLQYGARIFNKEGNIEAPIEVTTARKIILTTQLGYELKVYYPGIIRENRQGRFNIILNRDIIKDLYPRCMSNEGYIRYKDFSNAVSMAGAYYWTAIEKTGIKDTLKKKNIVIPATEKGAEFPKEHPNLVYLKADKLEK